MHAQRRYQEAEYTRVEGQPLPARRLAAIWRGLPECERFGFVLALTEEIADQVLVLTAQPATPAEGNRNDSTTGSNRR